MKMSTKELCVTAVMISLVCVVTMCIQIPIPMGYANLGSGCILIITAIFGTNIGMVAGGIGSCFADLLIGYSQWVIPTLIIKGSMGLIAGKIMYNNKNLKLLSLNTIFGSVISMIEVILGYMIMGAVLGNNILVGLSQAPGLIGEAIINLIFFFVMQTLFQKANIRKILKIIQ